MDDLAVKQDIISALEARGRVTVSSPRAFARHVGIEASNTKVKNALWSLVASGRVYLVRQGMWTRAWNSWDQMTSPYTYGLNPNWRQP